VRLDCLKEEHPTITISDNGDGIHEGEFQSEWLRFGGSWKRDKLFTRKGRPLLGQMGIGRFAPTSCLPTLSNIKAFNNGRELYAYVDWDKFDPHQKLLSETQCGLGCR